MHYLHLSWTPTLLHNIRRNNPKSRLPNGNTQGSVLHPTRTFQKGSAQANLIATICSLQTPYLFNEGGPQGS